ncbi:MAG: NAD(P)/FAD-dependent oxidoreductase [Candidatus Poseidoniaceae archaeon]
MISIIGAGLKGLSCGLTLQKYGYSVKIIEERQEIGNPIRSPGWLTAPLEEDIMKLSKSFETSIGFSVRREWLERAFATKFTSNNGQIILKTRYQINSPEVIDCTGYKSHYPGWPNSSKQNDEYCTWYGGLSLIDDLPHDFEINSINATSFCIERYDGLAESWANHPMKEPTKGWIEVMQGEHHKNIKMISATNSIEKGKQIATKYIEDK